MYLTVTFTSSLFTLIVLDPGLNIGNSHISTSSIFDLPPANTLPEPIDIVSLPFILFTVISVSFIEITASVTFVLANISKLA